ncbi:MAG: amino acid adenylation domain-containing protein, partial [Gammaproteobacteria bacterium]|nr:amino acid adenylation domain-containing protein [Gammaproteobacteria bacterium]
GLHLQPKQVFRYQTVAELAAVAGTTGKAVAEQGAVTGAAPLTPVQHWFFATTPIDPQHFNQSLRLQFNKRIERAALLTALQTLVAHHDALRLQFKQQHSVWHQQFADAGSADVLHDIDVSGQDDEAAENAIIDAAGNLQANINLSGGCLLHGLLIERGATQPQQLIIVIHHLAVDGVSWRILLEDLASACDAARSGEPLQLPAKTSSFRDWALALEDYSQDEALDAERAWWLGRNWPDSAAVPVDRAGGDNSMASLDSETISLDSQLTRRLLQDAPRAYRTQINDLLLSALARAWQQWSGLDSLLVDLEGHGREDKFTSLDVSRTVGWFTSIYPVCLSTSAGESTAATIKRVKEQLRAIPDKGFGYGVLRYLSAPAMAEIPDAQVMFNYLGQFDQSFSDDALLTAVEGSRGYEQSPRRQRTHLLDINGSVFEGQLNLAINYSRNLHDADSIARLAECFKQALSEIIEHCGSGASLGYTPSDFPLAPVSQTALDELLRAHPDLEEVYPVTPMQHGMLFHSLIADSNTGHSGQVYVTQVVWDLEGDLDAQRFEQAWQHVIDRHTALRTSFHTSAGDIPLAVVHERATVTISTGDWRSLSENEQSAQLTALLNADREQGYELEHAPLMRLYLFDCGNQQFKFVWSHHHIIIDGWSIPVLLNELFSTYDALSRAEQPKLAPARSYRDYIDWLQAQNRDEAKQFWRETLAGFNAPTPLPGAQKIFRGVQEDHDFDRYFATLSAAETRALRELARRLRLTLNTLAQGLWSLMISRYTGNDKVLFGATTSGRPADLANVEDIIGLFLNTVPVYTTVDPKQSARDWLATVQDGQLSARQYEYASLTDIQGWSDVPRGKQLFHSLMIFENYPDASALWEDRNAVRIRDMQSVGWTNFPLSAAVSVGSQLVLRLSYDLGYYTPASAAQLGDTYLSLLRGLLAQPDASVAELLRLPVPALRDQQPAVRPDKEFEFFSTGGVDGNIPRRFSAIVARYPDSVAVRTAETQWSYRELDARANAVAADLLAAGISPGDRVGLLLNHDAPMIAGLMGAMKAGATYVPLDPDAPELRLRAITLDADLRAVVTVAEHVAAATELAGINNRASSVVTVSPDAELTLPAPQISIEPDSLAYILFTSGSTGTPKGVMQTHRNTLHQVATYTNTLHLANDDRLALFSPYGFDAAIQDIFGALLNGASVSPISLKTAETPATLVDRIETLGISVFHATPTVYRYLFAQHEGHVNNVRIVVLGGEEARPDDLQLFRERFARDTVFVNGLGLTESTMTLQYFADQDTPIPADTLPAGKPVSGIEVRLLDDNGEETALSGEICIRSPYLTPGYWNAPELTAERFSRDSDGVPLFRTGDLARYDIDGNLIFTGRADTQLKVRGNRIEAGEVEAALRSHPGVAASVVLLLKDDDSTDDAEPRLTAYVAGTAGAPDVDALRAHLRERVPDYMIPAAIISVPEIPL